MTEARTFEKTEHWRRALARLYKRRLDRANRHSVKVGSLEQSLPDEKANYSSQQTIPLSKQHQFSKESLEFYEAINEGKRLSDNIEFQFATNFNDLKEMSTMVALTSGANAADVGISKLDCAKDMSRSLTSQQKLQ